MSASLLSWYNSGVKLPPALLVTAGGRGTRSLEDRMLDQSSLPIPAPETWRAVVGFEGRYEVSDLGRVRSLRVAVGGAVKVSVARAVPLVLREVTDRTGYRLIMLSGRRPRPCKRVHRLVLEAFVGPCPVGHQAAHLNGVRADNRLVNLAWKTPRENDEDKDRHGTMIRGDRHPARLHPERLAWGERNAAAKLTAAQVIEIRAARAAGESDRRVAARYGVSASTVGRIAHRQTWTHVT